MKNHLLSVSVLFLFLTSTLAIGQEKEVVTFDCFSMLIGKDATADGSVLFAHNEDDWGDRIVNWYQVPGKHHDPGSKISLKNGGILSQPRETYSYLWLEMPEMEFSDSYMNEWGVTISSDACQSRERDPELSDGGIGYWLRRAMAERAQTAREAVKIGGALVEQFGYTSSGRTYCISDPREAWMLSVVKGKHWVAQRVPDNHIAIIPNYYTITTIDLADTMNYYGAADLVDYAVSQGWYDPVSDGKFNFRLAYSDPGNLENMGNIVRHWSAINKIAPDHYDINADFPFSFKPKKKVELADLFDVLRNHNEGTKYDKSEQYTKGNPHDFGRAICSKTTQYGFVAQLRRDLPKEIAYVMWLAPFRPCVHPFTQWYIGMTEIPQGFAEQSYRSALAVHFDAIPDVFETAPDNKFLAYVRHAQMVDEDYKRQIVQLQARINTLEAELIQNQEKFEKKMTEMLSTDPLAAREAITDYCEEQLRR